MYEGTMESKVKFYEAKLHDLWKSQSFTANLKTITGDEITVLDVGVSNNDSAGPDFKNARIRIGNLVYVGDIEIDCDYSHWKSHGHNIDNKHNKVILHACLFNKNTHQYVYTKDGRRIPTVCLSNFIENNLCLELQKKIPVITDDNPLKCAHITEDVDYSIKKKFISELGIERFNKKCTRIHERLRELTYLKKFNIHEPVIRYDLKLKIDETAFTVEDFKDKGTWQQLLYEMVFEALGYSKNKAVMMKLAQNANLEFLKKLENDEEIILHFESALFHAAGLVPNKETKISDDVDNYIKKLKSSWNIIKRIYDSDTLSETDWHFFKLRPQNFPTIRIAGGARFVKMLLFENLISSITKKIIEIRNLSVLINTVRSLFVIKSRGFWKSHYIFDKAAKDEIKYFVGASRADEIVVNVVLPYFAVYFETFGKEELAKKVLKSYNIFNQRSDNKIVRQVAEGLNTTDFLKKTVLTQGLLELFRNYCSKKKCLECEIGKRVFE